MFASCVVCLPSSDFGIIEFCRRKSVLKFRLSGLRVVYPSGTFALLQVADCAALTGVIVPPDVTNVARLHFILFSGPKTLFPSNLWELYVRLCEMSVAEVAGTANSERRGPPVLHNTILLIFASSILML